MYDETALLNELASVVKTHANYDDDNVTVGSQRVLDKGVATAVVVEAGTTDSPEENPYRFQGGVVTIYNVTVYVYRKFVQDSESRASLRTDVQNVRETIDGYHELNGKAQSCRVISASAPLYIGVQNSPPSFIVRILTVSIEKVEEMTLLE